MHTKIKNFLDELKHKTPFLRNTNYIPHLIGWSIVVFLLRFAFLHLWHNDNGGRWIPIAVILFVLLFFGFGYFVKGPISSRITPLERLIILSLLFLFLIAFL